MTEIGELRRKADELRSRVGHGSEPYLKNRDAFDLCQLIEQLVVYLDHLAASQVEVD